MSEVCRTGGLRVKGMSEGYVGRLRKWYVGRVCRMRRRRIDFRRHIRVTLGPRAENGVGGMSDVCRKYVGQGDSGSWRRSEEILQDLPA